MLAAWPGVAEVVGVDPSPILLAKARELAGDTVEFREGDGRKLPFGDGEFDAVVLHRLLCHVPEPEDVLAEAFRVVRPRGRLAVFDGDYATITLATNDFDPLQTCIDAFRAAYLTDPWLVRRLTALVQAAGFEPGPLRSHGYVQIREPDYMVSMADRGADALLASGTIGTDLAEAFKAEARRRVDDDTFFGHVAYASLTAGKPG
jgi:SAM-dependent methyltransferase